MSGEEKSTFEPKIVAFCCNWCTYAGADLAGGMRLKYKPNFVTIRVMCSAKKARTHIYQEGGVPA